MTSRDKLTPKFSIPLSIYRLLAYASSFYLPKHFNPPPTKEFNTSPLRSLTQVWYHLKISLPMLKLWWPVSTKCTEIHCRVGDVARCTRLPRYQTKHWQDIVASVILIIQWKRYCYLDRYCPGVNRNKRGMGKYFVGGVWIVFSLLPEHILSFIRVRAFCQTMFSLQNDIWAETRYMGLYISYFACRNGTVYNVSDWIICQVSVEMTSITTDPFTPSSAVIHSVPTLLKSCLH